MRGARHYSRVGLPILTIVEQLSNHPNVLSDARTSCSVYSLQLQITLMVCYHTGRHAAHPSAALSFLTFQPVSECSIQPPPPVSCPPLYGVVPLPLDRRPVTMPDWHEASLPSIRRARSRIKPDYMTLVDCRNLSPQFVRWVASYR